MRINHNMSSINSLNNLAKTDMAMSKSLEKLSSGLRINRAADDAAGLAISEKMRAQINGLEMARRNAQDGISLLQTAEGGLNEVHAILQRMRELAVQAANGTYSAEDKANIKAEMDQLVEEIDNISKNTKFNGIQVLDAAGGTVDIQIGVAAGDKLTITLEKADKSTLGIDSLDVTSDAASAITAIDGAISKISTSRANLGAYQNRLEHTMNNLATTSENLQAAESRIRDADMAKEMAEFTRNQILIQAGISMTAQANQKSQSVMKLIG